MTAVVRSDVAGVGLTALMVGALYLIGRGGPTDVFPFPLSQRTVDPVAQWNTGALPFRFVTTLIVLTCFTYIAAPWYGQKIFAARTERIAFLGAGIAAVLVFLLYGRRGRRRNWSRERRGVVRDEGPKVARLVDWWWLGIDWSDRSPGWQPARTISPQWLLTCTPSTTITQALGAP